MITSCPNCNKKFKINPSLIPDIGRSVKCGSCNNVWFYKLDHNKTEPPPVIDNFIDKKIEDKNAKKQIPVNDKIKKNTSSKFFSYLVVTIISFVAILILIDTLKVPLINIFPGLEIHLFNLFEILKDIKLFIIDLY